MSEAKNLTSSDIGAMDFSPQKMFDTAVEKARSDDPGIVTCGGHNGEGCGAVKSGAEFIFPNGTQVPCFWRQRVPSNAFSISQDVARAYRNNEVDLEDQLKAIAKQYGVEYVPPRSESSRVDKKYSLTMEEEQKQEARVFVLS